MGARTSVAARDPVPVLDVLAVVPDVPVRATDLAAGRDAPVRATDVLAVAGLLKVICRTSSICLVRHHKRDPVGATDRTSAAIERTLAIAQM